MMREWIALMLQARLQPVCRDKHTGSDVFTNLTLLLAGLGELQEMTIGIAEEGSDLIAPVHRFSEELGSARAQHLVSGRAIRHPDGQLAADTVRVCGRYKGHGGIVLRGATWDREQDLTAPKVQ